MSMHCLSFVWNLTLARLMTLLTKVDLKTTNLFPLATVQTSNLEYQHHRTLLLSSTNDENCWARVGLRENMLAKNLRFCLRYYDFQLWPYKGTKCKRISTLKWRTFLYFDRTYTTTLAFVPSPCARPINPSWIRPSHYGRASRISLAVMPLLNCKL